MSYLQLEWKYKLHINQINMQPCKIHLSFIHIIQVYDHLIWSHQTKLKGGLERHDQNTNS